MFVQLLMDKSIFVFVFTTKKKKNISRKEI